MIAQDVTPELAAVLKLRSLEATIVVEVAKDPPAEKAGLKRADVVTRMNGRKIRSSSDLRNQLALTPIGEAVELKVQRQGHERTVRGMTDFDQAHYRLYTNNGRGQGAPSRPRPWLGPLRRTANLTITSGR